MTSVHMWSEGESTRVWASVGERGREHLLAQLMHGNLLSAESCALVVDAAVHADANASFEDHLGFSNSIGVRLEDRTAILDHAIENYGSFKISAKELAEVVSRWHDVLMGKIPNDIYMTIHERI